MKIKLPKWRIMTPAKITAMVEERLRTERYLILVECNRPLLRYVVKVAAREEPIIVLAHRFQTGRYEDGIWTEFRINDPKLGLRIAFFIPTASVEWIRSDGEVQEKDSQS